MRPNIRVDDMALVVSYVDGGMSEEDRIRFEARLAEDVELSAAVNSCAGVLRRVKPISVADVWTSTEKPVSYWILLMSGIDQSDEASLARELLLWGEFFAKGSARIACIQSSERRAFRAVASRFGISKCPHLVLSHRPDMKEAIGVDGRLLCDLLGSEGGIRRLLTEVHTTLDNGGTVESVRRAIVSKQFWEHVKLAYSEAKSLISITVTSD